MKGLWAVLFVLLCVAGGASGLAYASEEMPLVFTSVDYNVTDMATDGTYLYATTLADQYGPNPCAFRIFDVSSPTAPAEVVTLETHIPMWDFIVHPPNAFITFGPGGISYSVASRLDISDPLNPGVWEFFSGGDYYTSIGLTSDGSTLAIAGDTDLFVVTAPRWSSMAFWDFWPGSAQFSTGVGPFIYTMTGEGDPRVYAMHTLDLSEPSNPALLPVDLPTSALGMDAAGDVLCAIDAVDGDFLLWDVSTPTAPVPLAALPLLTEVPPMGPSDFHVDICGDYAVACLGSAGLRLLDISSPTAPAVIAEYIPGPEETEQRFHRAVIIPPYIYAVARVLFVIGSAPHAGTVSAAETAEGTQMYMLRAISAFPDLPLEHWAQAEVWACAHAGIVAGYPDGTYQADASVTRNQMAIYVSRALAGGDAQVPAGPAEASFADVPTDDVAYKYVEYAHANQIVFGYPDGLYHPEHEVDRGQMAIFIARATASPIGEPGMAGYVPPTMPTFADVTPDPLDPYQVCYKYVEYIADRGVTHGYPDGLYHPEYVVSRGLMAIYVARAFDLL